MRLHTKLMLGICTLIILMGGIFEVIFINILENNLKQETGEKHCRLPRPFLCCLKLNKLFERIILL